MADAGSQRTAPGRHLLVVVVGVRANRDKPACAAWVPEPGPGHREILGSLLVDRDLRAGLVIDAALAAICLEHGLAIVTADSDFARFPDLARINPV